jgi:hypothetical protein
MEVRRTEVEFSSDEPRSSDGNVLACNAATRAHSDGVATLLLELAAMALLQLAAALLELVVALCNVVGTCSGAMQRYWNS